MKFKNHYNTTMPKGEVNHQPSCTVPDDTMTLKELLARAMRGIEVPTKAPIYMGEHYDLPNPATMDLVDRQNLKEMAEQELMVFKEKYPVKTASPLGGTGGGESQKQEQTPTQQETPTNQNQTQ